MKSTITIAVAVLLLSFLGQPTLAQSESDYRWYLKPTLSFSDISDTTGSAENIANVNGPISIKTDARFSAGGLIGYQFNRNWASEVGWEYRTNDAETTLANQRTFSEGNYASNVFFANGIYTFDRNSKWRPYLGLGVTWMQEVDVDLEGSGPELSFSDSGDIGIQGFIGIDYRLGARWSLLGELRASRFPSIDLEGEGNSGSMRGLEYDPVSFQVGLRYNF